MTIDFGIVFSALVSFGIFFLIQIILLQIGTGNKSVYRIYRYFLVSWILGLMIGYFLLTYLISRFSLSIGQLLLIALLYAVSATLLIAVYIFGIFLMVYASIYLEILIKAAGFGQKGAFVQELGKLFNKNSIIKKRLQRLVDCGELTLSDGKYRLTQSRSPLLVREKIGIIITRLFP